MCLATVYVDTDGREEEVMRDVAWIRREGGRLQLVTLMGESRVFEAEIKGIDLMKSLIVLQGTPTDLRQMVPGEVDQEEG